MSVLVTGLIALATLAFGAVYAWGYAPLFAVAAVIGVAGIVRERGVCLDLRWLAVGFALVAAAVAIQLVPLPRGVLDVLSPRAGALLSEYSLTFAATSDSHPLSINSRATAVALAALVALGAYVVGLPSLLSRRDLRTLPRNLIVFAVPLAVLAIYGREHNNGLVYGFWQPFEGTNANGFGPFMNRNHFAGWMLMAICLATGVLCGRLEESLQHVKVSVRHRLIWLSTSEASRIVLLGAGIGAMAASLIWTMSRSGIVGFACAVACFGWLLVRRPEVKLGRRVVTIAALGLVFVASVALRGVDAVATWFGDTTDVVSRIAAWRDGWEVVRDFPLVGTGLNTYADAMLFYQRALPDMSITSAHNDYLQLLAEGGALVVAPAAIACLLLAGAIVRCTEQARPEGYDYWVRAGAAVGIMAIAIQESVEFSLHIPANAFLFATLAAIAMAPIGHANGLTRTRRSSRSGARALGTVV